MSLAEQLKRHSGPATESGCIPWTGAKDDKGYGRLGNKSLRLGTLASHRLAYELTHGPVPDGLFVLHRCDNPWCVNPDHLFVGTQADNMRDMRSKDRGPKGSSHGQAKLTEDMVREIRRRYRAGGETCRSLSLAYGVSTSVIGHVIKGDAWTHVLPSDAAV